jgi:DNA-binding transcriptional LysR family regulator
MSGAATIQAIRIPFGTQASMDIKLDDLLSFVATVRHQSLSRAAEALGLTQPAVTRRVQNLEEALSQTLLDRITKPPKPTPMGLRVYEQGMKVLQEVEALKHLVAQDVSQAGTLRLGLTQALAEAGLAPLLVDLRSHFPDLHPQVTTRWSSELVKLLELGELDAVGAMLPLRHSFPDAVRPRLLQPVDVAIVAASGRFPRTPLSLKDVHEAGWVLNPLGCGFRKHLQASLEEQGLSLRIAMEAFGTDLQLKTVAGGTGLGLMPKPLLAHSPYRDQLDVLRVNGFALETGLWLVTPVRSGVTPGALDLVGQTLQQLLA